MSSESQRSLVLSVIPFKDTQNTQTNHKSVSGSLRLTPKERTRTTSVLPTHVNRGVKIACRAATQLHESESNARRLPGCGESTQGRRTNLQHNEIEVKHAAADLRPLCLSPDFRLTFCPNEDGGGSGVNVDGEALDS